MSHDVVVFEGGLKDPGDVFCVRGAGWMEGECHVWTTVGRGLSVVGTIRIIWVKH